MNLCVLSTKQEDENFLNSQPVVVPVEIKNNEIGSLEKGKEIVVQLTNRKKYKAIIKNFELRAKTQIINGLLTLIKK